MYQLHLILLALDLMSLSWLSLVWFDVVFSGVAGFGLTLGSWKKLIGFLCFFLP
jgi:hypothetical protein